jgi:hypothetical protein
MNREIPRQHPHCPQVTSYGESELPIVAEVEELARRTSSVQVEVRKAHTTNALGAEGVAKEPNLASERWYLILPSMNPETRIPRRSRLRGDRHIQSPLGQ